MRSNTIARLLFYPVTGDFWSGYPDACNAEAPGMWTLSEIAYYLQYNRWPSSYVSLGALANQELKCVTTATLNANVYLPCGNSTIFDYPLAYFWEKSSNGGITWEAVSSSTFNLTSNKITIGQRAGSPTRENYLYGFIDSIRVTVGNPRYFADLISPYNPRNPSSALNDEFTKLSVNLGNDIGKTVGSTVIPVWTPTIGADRDIQDIRRTTTPGSDTSWDALWPVRQSSTIFGYQSATPAVQFVTRSTNFSSSTHYNYLEVDGSTLTTPAVISPGDEDFCVEGYVKIRGFRHSYNNSAGTSAVFLDTRSTASATDGIVVYFEPTTSATGIGRLVVNIPGYDRVFTYEPLYANYFYHVAVSKQLNTWRLYVNGVKRGEFSSQGSSLTLTGLSTLQNGTLYRYRVFYGALREAVSNPATITVLVANFVFDNLGDLTGPEIRSVDTSDNLEHIYTVGESVGYQFRASVYIENFTGGQFSYQWQVNDDPESTDPEINVWRDLAGASGTATSWGTWAGSGVTLTLNQNLTLTQDKQGFRVRVRCSDTLVSSRVIITRVVQ